MTSGVSSFLTVGPDSAAPQLPLRRLLLSARHFLCSSAWTRGWLRTRTCCLHRRCWSGTRGMMGALVSGCCGDPDNVQEGNRKWSCWFLGSNLSIRMSLDPVLAVILSRRADPTHQDHGDVEPAALQGDALQIDQSRHRVEANEEPLRRRRG